jgi:arsenate reductase
MKLESLKPKHILFICTGNSVRSIMAEVIARDLGGGGWKAFSAGARPFGFINPFTFDTLKAHGHNIDGLSSKSATQFVDMPFDIVVTVCDSARESCPVWPGQTLVEHWSIPDPALATGSYSDKRAFFERIYEDIRGRIKTLFETYQDEL